MSPARTSSNKDTRNGPRDKRGQVIDAAVELFLANGFDQTSMDAIAARAGVSKTTVYAHYDDKLALFRAVIERSASSLAVELDESRLLRDQEPEGRINHILLTVLEATTATEFLAFIRVIVTESARHEDLIYVMQDSESPDLIGLIATALTEEAAREGYSLSEPRVFATVLLRMVVASPQMDCLLFPKLRPADAVVEAHARWITSIFLRGIAPKSGEPTEVTPPAGGYDYPWLPDTLT